jgi:hypothetical protein
VDHCFDGMRIEFIDEYGIIMMQERIDSLIYAIAEEEGFIVEVYFYVHKKQLAFSKKSKFKIQKLVLPEYFRLFNNWQPASSQKPKASSFAA